MTGLEPTQYIGTGLSLNQVKLMNGWEYLYKITGLRPNQYPNTEMSPNQ